MAALSGWVPTVSVVSGRSFAGNASIAGISDVVIATRDSAIGLGGPPLVEAALGIKMTPDELGPAELHESVGGVDLMVETEAEAIEAAGRYLRYFLGDLEQYEESPQAARIRSIVPSNRRRAYDMRKVLRAVMDHDSVMELRPVWAPQAITALARLGGRAVGVIANQPLSAIAGAIDSDASDKLARFIQLCDAYDLPMVSFIDNPGYMVGRPAEASGIARHHARPIIAHHHRTVPLYTIQLRKAYGLGPAAMGNSYAQRDLRLAWPTAESGAMGLEGAALLVRRDEIAETDDPCRSPPHPRRVRRKPAPPGLRAQRRPPLRIRRRDRPRRNAGAPDRAAPPNPKTSAAHKKEAPHRRLVAVATPNLPPLPPPRPHSSPPLHQREKEPSYPHLPPLSYPRLPRVSRRGEHQVASCLPHSRLPAPLRRHPSAARVWRGEVPRGAAEGGCGAPCWARRDTRGKRGYDGDGGAGGDPCSHGGDGGGRGAPCWARRDTRGKRGYDGAGARGDGPVRTG